jgi:signal transduction histidine kinase/ligand-binding sensor domain-containing protein
MVGFCVPNPASALDPNKSISQYIHRKWAADNGFLGGQVYAISQSGDGYLWLATERGLVRFDGFRFTLVHRPIAEAPEVNTVRGLITDGAGNLWIRLDEQHLLRYANGRFEDVLADWNLPFAYITAMSLDSQGRLIVSGLGDQILRFDNGRFEAIASAKKLLGTILAIVLARDDTLWVGTRDGGLYHVSGGTTTHIPGMLGATKINALLPATNGGVWVGTDNGLFLLDSSGKFTTKLPEMLRHIEVTALTSDRDANVWAATNLGLYRVTHTLQASFEAQPKSDASELTAVYQDSDNDIWYGSSRGIFQLRESIFTTWSTADGLPSNNNGPIYTDSKGRTWFAPYTGGLYWLQKGHIEQVSEAGLNHDVVYSICGGNNEIWLGRQHGGITELIDDGNRFRSKSFTTKNGPSQNAVYSVRLSRDGTVWAATAGTGVLHIDNDKMESITLPPPLSNTAVNSIVEGSDGTIWIGSTVGLGQFAKGRWSSFTTANGLPSSYVQTILEDSEQTLWIATSSGLAYLRGGVIKVPGHLPDPLRANILSIAEDEGGNLWFSASDRIWQVNRDGLLDGTLRETDVQSYGIEDGLPGVEGVSRDRTMVSDSSGRIWISLNRGLAVADPNLSLALASPITARLESFVVDGLSFAPANVFFVASNPRSIAFHFSSTTLLDPSRIRFRYKLENSDQNWSEIVDLHDVVYRNLGPGDYRFRIIASNPAGLWNGPETAVPFVIGRAFWQTWWFRLSCLALIALTAVFLYQLRMTRMTAQLNARFQERLAERTRIARELHDTLLQTLHGLMFQFQAVRNLMPRRPTEAMQSLDDAISDTKKALAESREAIQGLRSESIAKGDLGELLIATSQELVHMGHRDHEAPTFDLMEEGDRRTLSPTTQNEICRIALEILRNAYRHAHARKIEAEIRYGNQMLRLRIRDDGKGMDPEVLKEGGSPGHWGLRGVRERAKRIGAQVDFWSEAGAGTEFQLEVPANVAYEISPDRVGSRFLRKVRNRA